MRRLSKFAAITAGFLTVAMPPVEALGQAPITASDPAEPGLLRVNIDLIVDTLPERMQAKVAAELERQFAVLAEQFGLVLVPRDAATLFVRLELNQPDKSAEVFLVDTVAVYDGDVLPRESARACIQCTPAEMVEDGLKIVPSALAQIEQRRAEAAVAAAQAEAAAEQVEDAPSESPPMASVRQLGAAGYVGISSSVLGLGSTIGSSVLLARGSPDPTSVQDVNLRAPGTVLVGAGLGMMVVGAVLLAVDLTVLEQRRRSKARARIDSVSLGTTSGPALVVSGRF
jgi:hypothetical protein